MSSPMDIHILAFCLLLAISFGRPVAVLAKSTPPTSSRITVVGAVYCDTCLNSGFSRHSYFIPGVDVHIQCKFSAKSPKTAEMITFSVNRTTDIYGVYKLEIPSVDGVDCVDGPPIQSFCQASLLGSSSSVCDIPSLKATTTEISVKSKQENLCVYSFTPLSFRPSKRNGTLCRKRAEASNSVTSSESLLSHEGLLPTKQTSSIPQAANLQSLPFPFSSPPPLLPFPNPFSAPPSLPFPFSSPPPSFPFPFPFSSPPPSLPFPFPHLPTPPSIPSLFPSPPPPPSFNLGDPTTWIPHVPLISPSPPPPPPPPPAFDLRDPKTWTPIIPPFSPPSLQKQNP